jgi:type VII secretion integral membrane protein EccD
VTIVAPTTRVDLSLPVDIPFADMMLTLLRHAGNDLADDVKARDGWTLSRLGGGVLDSSSSPAQLEIRDGELLYLLPRGAEPPELTFDDVVDAVATSTNERAGRWQPTTTRTFGLGLAVITLVAGAAAILFAGPPHVLGGLVGLGAGIALLLTAIVLSRGFGQAPVGSVFALLALPYAAVGGTLVAADGIPLDRVAAPQLLIAAGVLFFVASVAMVGVAEAGPVFLAVDIAAGALLVGAGVCFVTGASAAAGAAVLAAFAFAWLPLLPTLAFRLAGMPIPSVPTSPDDLKNDTETVDGRRILARADRADGFLAGLLGALAVIGLGAGVVVTSAGLAGLILAAVLGLLMLTRARSFLSRRQRLPLLVAGATALTATIVALYLSGGQVMRLAAVPAFLAVAGAAGTGLALSSTARRLSPVLGRMLDMFETLLIVSVVPLAVWASGLYAWVRSLNG